MCGDKQITVSNGLTETSNWLERTSNPAQALQFWILDFKFWIT